MNGELLRSEFDAAHLPPGRRRFETLYARYQNGGTAALGAAYATEHFRGSRSGSVSARLDAGRSVERQWPLPRAWLLRIATNSPSPFSARSNVAGSALSTPSDPADEYEASPIPSWLVDTTTLRPEEGPGNRRNGGRDWCAWS